MTSARSAMLLVALLLVACGIGSGSETTATKVAPEPSPTTSTEAAPSTTAPTSTGSTAVVAGCGAAGLPSTPPAQDIPAAVAATRESIVAAAVACDFVRLADLASSDFTYSFGDGGDPAAFWSQLESDSATTGSVSPLSMLVRVLGLPFGTIDDGEGGTLYVWPSAQAYDGWDAVPEPDREALLDVYGVQDLAAFEAFGGYAGYRVGIDDAGDWKFFVAGD